MNYHTVHPDTVTVFVREKKFTLKFGYFCVRRFILSVVFVTWVPEIHFWKKQTSTFRGLLQGICSWSMYITVYTETVCMDEYWIASMKIVYPALKTFPGLYNIHTVCTRTRTVYKTWVLLATKTFYRLIFKIAIKKGKPS